MDKEKRKYIIPSFICTLFLSMATSVHAQTARFEMPGTVTGTGMHFAVTTSKYLNITIDSTQSISLYGESVPNSIMLEVSSSSVATSTTLTISGLVPSSPYYIHEDNYHNTLQITADAHGMLGFLQDLMSDHRIFILPHPSTVFLKNDATGGNCTAVGIWDSDTKTCTLTTDISETIEVDDSGITLDGNNHAIRTPDLGVLIPGTQGVTVKNLTISAASTDILFSTPIGVMTPQTVIENNVLEGTGVGIDPGVASGVVIKNNRSVAVAPGLLFGIHARGQTFQGGFTIVNNSFPVIRGEAIFAILGLSSNLIANNTIGSPQFPHGIAFAGIVVAGSDVTIHDNTVQEVNSAESGEAALVILDSGNFNNNFTIFHNNFFNNGVNVSGLEAFLSHEFSSNGEGNFWGHTSLPCYITSGPNADTDNPLLVDSHPFCQKNGWLMPTSTPQLAAAVARGVVGEPYGYGGKGYDFNLGHYVTQANISDGYSYYKANCSGQSKTVVLTAATGLDCSGLVMWSFNTAFGATTKFLDSNPIQYPGADAQFKYNSSPIAETDLSPGDLMFFDFDHDGRMDHVAMYLGGDDVIEAPDCGIPIRISSKSRLELTSGFLACGPNGNAPCFRRVTKPIVGLAVRTHSPVSLSVTDPDGLNIDANTVAFTEREILREIPGAFYYLEDTNNDDTVLVPTPKPGAYLIKVFPKPGALSTDTYSVTVEASGSSITLADSVPISNIPASGYGIETTGNAIRPFIPVHIDLKSDRQPATINMDSRGLIRIAIFSNSSINVVSQLDQRSLSFGHSGTEASLAFCDADETDGIPATLICHFYVNKSGLQIGDTQGILQGVTLTGNLIRGAAAVRVIQNSSK